MAAATPDSTLHLFTNGSIFLPGVKTPGTSALHQAPAFAECLLVRNDKIEYVGAESADEVKNARAAGAVVHDVQGKTVLPGFVDGHMHLMLMGQSLNKLDIGKCKSLQDIHETIKAYALAHPELPRLLCRGWMHSMTGTDVTAAELEGLDGDRDRPILIDSKDLHTTWCNKAAIKELGADEWKDVPGGLITRDAEGKPNGLFSEAANITYVWPYLAANATVEERKDAIRAAVRQYHESGYTGLIDMAMDQGAWDALQALREDGEIPMRIAAYWLVKPSETPEGNLEQVDKAVEMAAQFSAASSPDCRVVGIKVICDGIIDGCTAGLSEPYSHNNHTEVPLWTFEELEPVVKKADAAGLQIALHAIGDGTIKMVVDVLEAHARRERRPRIEHIELASAADSKRLGNLGITASIQPVHADPAILRAWPKLLGEHRCKRAFAYREFADHGSPLALGSDAPTAPNAPLGNVYVGATRRSFREPEYTTTVNPEYALGVCEGIVAGTEGAAYSCFDEERVGRLVKGQKADFLVVDMQWEKEKLKDAAVTETWYNGKQVFSKSA
ncbi:amidohydrolase 3 [Thozetella sp. PMI_491]|nr:amidohydrolase 3 [Thozetella sp. PMI_491]